jgi:hypothetical protein
MNPGDGKVRRDCPVHCISGGVPAALRVRDRNGPVRTLLLASDSESALVPGILPYVAEPVRIRGTLISTDGVLVLRTSPSAITRE